MSHILYLSYIHISLVHNGLILKYFNIRFIDLTEYIVNVLYTRLHRYRE